MAQIVREADIRWLSHPPEGVARISVHSRAFTSLVMSLTDEPEPHPHEVTPGELLAAGFAASLATDLAELLRDQGHPATELVANGACTFSGSDTELPHRMTRIDFRVHARVPGIDESAFAAAADEAVHHFVAGAGLRPDLDVHVDAVLVGATESG